MTLRSWNTSSSKTPGASQSTTSVAPEHNACNDDTPVDPFLLDFGTSVNVNEDLRHVIRGEIQEIDESINVVGSEMKKEETVEKQLRHDLAHSLSEMTNLSRCVNDQLENVHVHTTFLQGLQSTLQVDLVLSSGIKARNASVVSPQQDCDQNATSLKESAKQSNSYKDIIHCCGKKLKKMTSSMKEASRDLEELFAKHRTTIEMTQAIQQRIEVDALETVLKERTQEGNLVMQELEATKDNLQAIKLATHKKRTESGSNAQQLADLTKELDAVRREAEMQKIELLQKLSESRELVAKGQTKVDDQKSQIDQVTANLEKLAKQKLLLKELTESKLALDVEEKRHDDLLRRKAQLATKLEESEHEVKESAEELHEAQQLDAKATKLKAENDENHNLIVVPGRVELCDIAEKKENLAKLIEETQKTNSDLEISEKESLASKLETKRMALEELAVLEKEVQSVKAKMAFVDKTNKESKDLLKREIKEHVSLEKNLRAAVDAKHAHLEEMRETQSKHLRQSIDEATLVAEKEKEKDERLISILRAGMELFNKTEKRLELLGETLDI